VTNAVTAVFVLVTPPPLSFGCGGAVALHLAFRRLVVQEVVDFPAVVRLTPHSPPHQLGRVPLGFLDSRHLWQVFSVDGAVREVAHIPAESHHMQQKRGVRERTDLAVDGELVVEADSGHQVSPSWVRRRTSSASWSPVMCLRRVRAADLGSGRTLKVCGRKPALTMAALVERRPASTSA